MSAPPSARAGTSERSIGERPIGGRLLAYVDGARTYVNPGAVVSDLVIELAPVLVAEGASEIAVLAVGKAAVAMMQGAWTGLQQAAPTLARSGMLIYPDDASGPVGPNDGRLIPWTYAIEYIGAAHPVPDARSLAAGRRALAWVSRLPPSAVLLALVSGGASALMAQPRDGLTLADKQRQIAACMASGASIIELNRLRQSLSAIKGGGLARATPARVINAVISDVWTDDLAIVGSGPAYDEANPEASLLLLEMDAFAGHVAELATADGWDVVRGPAMVGPVQVAAVEIASRAQRLRPGELLVLGGEVTIALPAQPGQGGRAQHLALALAPLVAGTDLVVMCIGTDGRDGPRPAAGPWAAGALVDGTSAAKLQAVRVDIATALASASSATALAAIEAQLVIGPTGVNHGDLYVVARPVA